MDRVRLAIVGCGNISQLNAPGYLQHPRCDVVALCDTAPERAKRRAREGGIAPRVYPDFGRGSTTPRSTRWSSSHPPGCTPTTSWRLSQPRTAPRGREATP